MQEKNGKLEEKTKTMSFGEHYSGTKKKKGRFQIGITLKSLCRHENRLMIIIGW